MSSVGTQMGIFMIGQTISHYHILEKLGGGGMGVVYKAEDTQLRRTVALKFLSVEFTNEPEAKGRFIREAQAASALQHANICTIHDIGETSDGQLFIVMDSYEGETLKRKIDHGLLEIDEAVATAMQIAQGLARAHELGIVHRDIKPANIIVTTRKELKILDFGLAKLSGRTLLTKSGTTIGTAAYMSPEQAKGEQVDQRTDIWSLGVVFYEMLTGKRPFESEYEQALMYSIVNQEPKPPKEFRPEIPDVLEKIVRRAMAKSIDERYQSATELIADLEAYKSGSEISRQTKHTLSRKRKMLYVVGLGVVVLAAAAFFYTSRSGKVFDSIAVLPFETISKDTTQLIFAQGLTEEVIGKLWQVASLRVPSLKSVTAMMKPGMTYAQIAEELGVKAILDAPILRVGNRVRISARLMDPATDKPLWSETYEREMSDVLALQAELAQAIVRQVNVTVTPQEKARLSRSQQKVDPKAYELYLRARNMWNNISSEEEWKTMVRLLQQAIAIDSTYAAFPAWLSRSFRYGIFDSHLSREEGMSKAEEALQRALSLDSLDLQTLMAVAGMRGYQWRWKEADRAYDRMLEINPGDPRVMNSYAIWIAQKGDVERGLELFKRARAVDPSIDPDGSNLMSFYFSARRYDDVINIGLEGLKAYPKRVWIRNILGQAYAFKGMKREAIAEVEKSIALEAPEEEGLLFVAGLASIYGYLRMPEKAQDILNRYLAKQKGKPVGSGRLALVYASMGKAEDAFHWLDRAYRESDPALMDLKIEPAFDSIRSDPRYAALVKKIGFWE
jgi:eukaryotic-like serine/threonine-protein kinase